jgi:glycyl-tRNA synthetase beta chain
MAAALRCNISKRKQQKNLRAQLSSACLKGHPMNELVLEIYSEEIPARMQKEAKDQFYDLWSKELNDQQITFTDLYTTINSQRMVLCVMLDPMSAGRVVMKRGPKIGAPSQAMEGFLRLTSLKPEDLHQENGYWYAKQEVASKKTSTLIPAMVEKIIHQFQWPKSMRWPQASKHWVRPVRHISCIYDHSPLIFFVQSFALNTQSSSKGHRFLANDSFSFTSFDDYKEKLRQKMVIVDWDDRKELIKKELKEKLFSHRLRLKDEQSPLLDEICGLVEYPFIGIGKIDEKYMKLPQAVMDTTMEYHQKFLPLEYQDGTQSPFFAFVSNTLVNDDITKGCEKVLKARLEDAQFFFQQDLSASFDHFNAQLNHIVYHQKLGTLGQKVERLVDVAPDEETKHCAAYCKADLASQMVSEFPELQGKMGKIYALHWNQDEIMAQALHDYYAPINVHDPLPTSWPATNLSIVDKLDTLVGLLGIGQHPTGSKDPYALRRAAYGVIRMIIEKPYPGYYLRPVIDDLFHAYQGQGVSLQLNVSDQVIDWIHGRFIHYIHEAVGHFPVEHLLSFFVKNMRDDDLYGLHRKITFLYDFYQNDQIHFLLQALKRIYGIAKNVDIQTLISSHPDPSLFSQEAEHHLWNAIQQYLPITVASWGQNPDPNTLNSLFHLTHPMNQFFDEVTVQSEDFRLCQNRQALVYTIKTWLDKIVDFTIIINI